MTDYFRGEDSFRPPLILALLNQLADIEEAIMEGGLIY